VCENVGIAEGSSLLQYDTVSLGEWFMQSRKSSYTTGPLRKKGKQSSGTLGTTDLTTSPLEHREPQN
jgi:hypothetical protein